MKKGIAVFMPILMAVLLCSCAKIRDIKLPGASEREPEKIQSMSEEIIRCLTEKDKDSFKNLFCEQVRKREGFDGQLEELFDSFVCDTYTASEIQQTASGGESKESGERTEWYVCPERMNIVHNL